MVTYPIINFGFAEKVVLFWHHVDIQRNKLIT